MTWRLRAVAKGARRESTWPLSVRWVKRAGCEFVTWLIAKKNANHLDVIQTVILTVFSLSDCNPDCVQFI